MEQLEQYYRTNYKKLVNRVRSSLGSIHNAEDAVQTAFCNAIKYLPSYKPEEDFGHWFNGILNNASKDIRNQERRRGFSIDDVKENLFRYEPTPIFNMMLKEIQQDIYNIENPKHHEICRLYFLTQYSPKEISEIINESVNNIRVIVYRFREDLRVKYGQGLYW